MMKMFRLLQFVLLISPSIVGLVSAVSGRLGLHEGLAIGSAVCSCVSVLCCITFLAMKSCRSEALKFFKIAVLLCVISVVMFISLQFGVETK